MKLLSQRSATLSLTGDVKPSFPGTKKLAGAAGRVLGRGRGAPDVPGRQCGSRRQSSRYRAHRECLPVAFLFSAIKSRRFRPLSESVVILHFGGSPFLSPVYGSISCPVTRGSLLFIWAQRSADFVQVSWSQLFRLSSFPSKTCAASAISRG